MKKLLFILALSVGMLSASGADAQDIVITDFKFEDEGDYDGALTIYYKNQSKLHIKAFKANLVCTDAFGDEIVNIALIDRATDLPPQNEKSGVWSIERARYFIVGWDIMTSTPASAFDCKLMQLKTVK